MSYFFFLMVVVDSGDGRGQRLRARHGPVRNLALLDQPAIRALRSGLVGIRRPPNGRGKEGCPDEETDRDPDGSTHPAKRFTTRVALCPPNPKEFERNASTLASREVLGT